MFLSAKKRINTKSNVVPVAVPVPLGRGGLSHCLSVFTDKPSFFLLWPKPTLLSLSLMMLEEG